MAHQRVDLESLDRAGGEVVLAEPQPVHPGVQHDMAHAATGFAPTCRLLHGVENGRRDARQRQFHVLVAHAVEDRQAGQPQRRQRSGLGPGGDKEVATSDRCQPLRNPAGAEPITIGFDRRAARSGPTQPRKRAPIGDQGVGIATQTKGSCDHAPLPSGRAAVTLP